MLVMRSRNLEARERLEEALRIAVQVEARAEQAEALNYLGCALSFLGAYPTAIDHLRSAVRLAREGGVLVRGLSQYENLSEILSDSGQLENALDVAGEGMDAARELGMQRSYGLVLTGRAARCALALGRNAEAARVMDRLRQWLRDHPTPDEAWALHQEAEAVLRDAGPASLKKRD